eukprot:1152402-Pelagomonas_calceolata.AAC.11
MLRAGMSVARIDLTWGPLDYHRKTLQNLQEAMKRSHKLCAVMIDTLGREVRFFWQVVELVLAC